ncbi:MAG: hypothetical protein JO212_12525 [Acetobacteraceae bacterium]|nr:hypothetical protein [Acetobacteraceae bacterium]
MLDDRLQIAFQGNATRPEDQLVEVLPVVSLNGEPGMNVLVNEMVVEHHDIRYPSVPGALHENGVWRAARSLDD